jgi:hypothetical protein
MGGPISTNRLMMMLRILVDVNSREGRRTIVIAPENVVGQDLRVGMKVILHEPGMECEAVLRHGQTSPWVADIIEGTTKEVPWITKEFS